MLKPLTKVTYAFATKTVGALAMNIVVGQELGYYRDEGLDLDFKAISTHVALLKGIRNGSLQFAVGSPTFFLPVAAAKDGSFPSCSSSSSTPTRSSGTGRCRRTARFSRWAT